MHLGNQGTAFLPGGCSLPEGPYTVYVSVDVSDGGAATGEVHFLSEPNYSRPIAIGKEFDLHVPHPDSILGDSVILNLRFVDNAGSVAGHVHGSLAQFRPKHATQSVRTKDDPMSSRDVFVIHGRDERLRAGIFEFLRSLGLNPMEWTRAVELTGKGSPYVGEVLDAAFSNAQAVVVLFSPDDVAMLRPELQGSREPEHETNLTPQARPNVLFEAGMAMARHPDRTILVEIGSLRPFSDIGGRHMVRMDNSTKKRNELATRLKTAGCPINLAGTDWQTTGDMQAPELHPEAERSQSELEAKPITEPAPAFSISLAADGTPPSQTIKVSATAPIRIVRLEYMLSNETCVAAEDISLEGKTAQIPLNHDLIRKVWNVPRSDRNNYDHSGPAKIGVTFSSGGKVYQHVLPVQMESALLGNTMYARIVGSKTFYGT